MSFDSFLGNAPAVRSIRQMLAGKRVPGALLFAGPDGIGKRTLALMLAKAMNCERNAPKGDDFCGECARCRKSEEMLASAREDLEKRRSLKDASRRVEGLIYYDLQLIEPITRFILTEQIRQLRTVSYTHPFEFPRRVFIVDQAQAIHWQGVDVLLKVLEEPPPTTTLILICPNAHELRPTIRSRCQKVYFVAVEDETIESLIAQQGGVEKAHRALAARVAGGSVARAMAFNYSEFQGRRRPWMDFFESLAGKGRRSGAEPDWKRLFDSTRALTEKREEFEDMLRTGYSLLRDIVQIQQAGKAARVTNVDLLPQLKEWAGRFDLSQIVRLKTALDEAYRLQTRNVNQQLALDALATEFAEPQNAPPGARPSG
jgi:DNA polymerase III subunit delta'